MAELRSKVLQCYRTLQRTRRFVFQGDQTSLEMTRKKLNEEFRKNQHLTNPEAIQELLKAGYEVSDYLRANILQARLNQHSGAYEVHIHKDTMLLDNMPYLGGDCAPPRRRRERSKPATSECCMGSSSIKDSSVDGCCGGNSASNSSNSDKR